MENNTKRKQNAQPKIRNAKKVYCLREHACVILYEHDNYLGVIYNSDIFPNGLYVTAYSPKQARVYMARRFANKYRTRETTAIYDYHIEFSDIICVTDELEKNEKEIMNK